MKTAEKNVRRLVAVQHLRTSYGVKTKNWNKNKQANCKIAPSNTVSYEKRRSVLFACCESEFALNPLGLRDQEVCLSAYYCLGCWIKFAYYRKREQTDTRLFTHRSPQMLCLPVVMVHTINSFNHKFNQDEKGKACSKTAIFWQ